MSSLSSSPTVIAPDHQDSDLSSFLLPPRTLGCPSIWSTSVTSPTTSISTTTTTSAPLVAAQAIVNSRSQNLQIQQTKYGDDEEDDEDDDAYWQKYGHPDGDEEPTPNLDTDCIKDDIPDLTGGYYTQENCQSLGAAASQSEPRRILASFIDHPHDDNNVHSHRHQTSVFASTLAPTPIHSQVDPTTLAHLLERLVEDREQGPQSEMEYGSDCDGDDFVHDEHDTYDKQDKHEHEHEYEHEHEHEYTHEHGNQHELEVEYKHTHTHKHNNNNNFHHIIVHNDNLASASSSAAVTPSDFPTADKDVIKVKHIHSQTQTLWYNNNTHKAY
ncbi:hypothetical protein BGZ94_004214 [Podila epigama]|nr:hypothetical protein BGZ94_004214 [Podila epigama]